MDKHHTGKHNVSLSPSTRLQLELRMGPIIKAQPGPSLFKPCSLGTARIKPSPTWHVRLQSRLGPLRQKFSSPKHTQGTLSYIPGAFVIWLFTIRPLILILHHANKTNWHLDPKYWGWLWQNLYMNSWTVYLSFLASWSAASICSAQLPPVPSCNFSWGWLFNLFCKNRTLYEIHHSIINTIHAMAHLQRKGGVNVLPFRVDHDVCSVAFTPWKIFPNCREFANNK